MKEFIHVLEVQTGFSFTTIMIVCGLSAAGYAGHHVEKWLRSGTCVIDLQTTAIIVGFLGGFALFLLWFQPSELTMIALLLLCVLFKLNDCRCKK